MFVNIGKNGEYVEMLADYFKDLVSQPPPESVNDAAARVARFLGFRAFHVRITTSDGSTTPIDQCTGLDPNVHENIAHMLNALAV